jgi:hypothetical protein
VDQAAKLCELGASESDLANFFNVTTVTIWRWRSSYPDFCNAVKVGKHAADDRVEVSLYHRAVGYTYSGEKVFQFQGKIIRAPLVEHVPPDVAAATLWLKNRRPAQWRDKQDVQIDVHMSLAELVNMSYRSDLPKLPAPPVDPLP